MAGLQLDPVSYRVTVDGHLLNLGPKEYRLLHFFMTPPERTYGRTRLIDVAWDVNAVVDERTVDAYLARLRRLLRPSGHGRLLRTVRGGGYCCSIRGCEDLAFSDNCCGAAAPQRGASPGGNKPGRG